MLSICESVILVFCALGAADTSRPPEQVLWRDGRNGVKLECVLRPAKPEVADELHVSVRVEMSRPGTIVRFPDQVRLDEGLRLVRAEERYGVVAAGRLRQELTLTLRATRPGRYQIGPLDIALHSSDSLLAWRVPAVEITVGSALNGAIGSHWIRPPPPPLRPGRSLWPFAGGVAVAVLAVVGWVLFRRLRIGVQLIQQATTRRVPSPLAERLLEACTAVRDPERRVEATIEAADLVLDWVRQQLRVPPGAAPGEWPSAVATWPGPKDELATRLAETAGELERLKYGPRRGGLTYEEAERLVRGCLALAELVWRHRDRQATGVH